MMDITEQDYQKAVAVVMDCSSGSVSNLQRKLHWGYARAAAAIDRMQEEFIVGPMSPSGRRDVYPSSVHQLWKDLNAAKAVPEGFVLVPTKSVKYFSNDGENYETHNTLAEAKHEAECAIEYFRDRLADQLSDPRSDGNFNDVGYGVILGQSAYSLDHVVIQEDIDNGDCSYEVGTEIMSLFLVEAQEQGNV